MDSTPVLRVEKISKEFPGVKALNDISLELKRGEILALLGENGAGKSTLIKILSGVYKATSGKIYIDDRECLFGNPTQAKDAGISVVYQELSFVSELSVAENLFINQYREKNHVLNWKKLYAQAEKIIKEIGLNIDVRRIIGHCSVSEKQQAEIARAIYEKAKILIFDEPTSALNAEETAHFLQKLLELKKRNVGIIFITHKMQEIFAVADRVFVLRDGHAVAQLNIQDVNEQSLIKLMVGREVTEMYPEKQGDSGEVVLLAKKLNNKHIKDISFELHKGEILGVYGLMGSGHLEFGRTLFGCYKKTTGVIKIDNTVVKNFSPQNMIKHGIVFLPSERKIEGLVLIQSVSDNINTASYETGRGRKLISRKKESIIAKKWIKKLSIKTPGIHAVTATLSGGNQQKTVLAKWLETNPDVIILNEPTRGIDVGSKAEIYSLLRKLCSQGVSIIMITSEMPELLGMSDSVLVMHENKIHARFNKSEISETNIIEAAIGGY